ncbi:hypothetical protein EV424DRAFT_1630076 [Suillus variegatus]|nr:hypothetical protein EV424DRAFT_1630076 [Suillus variegatus]
MIFVSGSIERDLRTVTRFAIGKSMVHRLAAAFLGTAGSCWRLNERGKVVSIYTLVPLLGPVLGHITGAWIAERSTWRWVFWSMPIVDATILIIGVFSFQESYAPLLLEIFVLLPSIVTLHDDEYIFVLRGADTEQQSICAAITLDK